MCLKRHLLQCTGDFWAKFNCDEVLDVRLGAVDSKYGNKGLGREMIEANLSLGKVLGIKVNYIVILFQQKFVYWIKIHTHSYSHHLIDFFTKVAKAEATGLYSQSIYKKLGFETLGRFAYEDYLGKDEKGNPVFQNMGKHKSIDFVVKTIP